MNWIQHALLNTRRASEQSSTAAARGGPLLCWILRALCHFVALVFAKRPIGNDYPIPEGLVQHLKPLFSSALENKGTKVWTKTSELD